MRFLKLLTFLLLSIAVSATVTVNANLTLPTGAPANYAFLEFDLKNCGYNVPVVPGNPGAMVVTSVRFTKSQLPAAIFGNNEITCGNVYSTLWHVTAYTDTNTPIAGDFDYAICSSAYPVPSYCPSTSGTWELENSQPFSGNPPPPGWNMLYGNPTQNQTDKQPTGTIGYFLGTFDFSGATVLGLSSTPSPLTTKGDLYSFSNVNGRLPIGANGTVLCADSTQPFGMGWENCVTGGGIPGGSDTQIQFNKFGAFGGQSSLLYNYNTDSLINSASGTFTNTQMNQYLSSWVGGISTTLYHDVGFPGYASEAGSFGIALPSGMTGLQGNGIAGYMTTACNSLGRTTCNGVAVFGLAVGTANGAGEWGANFVVNDEPGITSNVEGTEIDVGVSGTPSFVHGLDVTLSPAHGVSGTMPNTGNNGTALSIQSSSPSTLQWLNGVYIAPQSINSGGSAIWINANCTSGPCSSPPITFTGLDSGSVAHFAQLAATSAGILQLNGSNVCTTANGYCGGSGSVGGSGTVGTIPEWSGSTTTLGDSPIVDGGSTGITVTVPSTGAFTVNTGTTTGAQLILEGAGAGTTTYLGSSPQSQIGGSGTYAYCTFVDNGVLTCESLNGSTSKFSQLSISNTSGSGAATWSLKDETNNKIYGIGVGAVGAPAGVILGVPSGNQISFFQNGTLFAGFNSTGANFAFCSSGQYLKGDGTGCGSGLASPSFSAITSGTNTNALLIGSAGSLSYTGTGTINANYLLGSALAALPGSLSSLCYTSSAWSWCPLGTGTVTVVGSGNLTSTAIVTGGGTTTLQTPSATSTLDSSGDMSLAGTLGVTGLTTLTGGASIPSGATVTVASGGVITISGTGEINANYLLGGALPSLSVSAQCLEYTGSAWAFTTCGSGGGGVSTFSAGNLSPLFTTSVANPTSAPALSFSLSNANADTILGNPTGSPAGPSFFGVSLPLAFGSSLLGCPTCVTSAASLTSNAVVIGGGGQATSTISVATTTTYALFATAGAPAFRAIASGDLPTIPNTIGGTGQNSSSSTGIAQVLSGTWSFSTALANGTTATTQTIGDSTTKVATDQFVLQNAFTNPCTLLGCTIYGGTGGSATALNGPTGPTGVTEVYTSTPSGGSATAPQWSIPGVQLDEQTGTSYTIPATDNYHWVTANNASNTAWSGANMLVNNYAFHGASLVGTITYTPASGKIFPGNGSTGLTSQIIPQYWFFESVTDNTNTYMAVMPTISAFTDCHTAGTSAVIFTAATGTFGCNSITGGGSAAFSAITSGTNTTAAMLCGSGCTLGVTGSGTIAATSAPFSGLTPGVNTSTTAWEIAPSATVGGIVPTFYMLGPASETDTGALLKLNTGSSSVQPSLWVGTTGNAQFQVCAQGSGIAVFGSAVPCTSIGSPATGNIIMEASATTVQINREYQASAAYVVAMNQWNTKTAPGTGFQFLQAYAGVTSSDTTSGGGTLVYELLGNGSIDVGTWNATAIAPTYGGTGLDSHTLTGVAQVSSGTWSVGALALTSLATQSANTILGNFTASSAAPTANTVPSCSTNNSALQYATASGLQCNTGVASLSTIETFTAAQTFTNSDLLLLGSSTGATTFTSANASATNYTLTVPAATDTMALLAATQTFTNKTYSGGAFSGTFTGAPTFSGNIAFTGTPTFSNALALGSSTASTQTACDDSTKLATTAYNNIACTNVESSGSPLTLAGLSGYYYNDTSSAYTFQLDAPVLGKQYCFANRKARTSALTIKSTTGVTIYYKGVAGTTTTGTLVSGGAAGDAICLVGTDSTTYEALGPGQGTWVNN